MTIFAHLNYLARRYGHPYNSITGWLSGEPYVTVFSPACNCAECMELPVSRLLVLCDEVHVKRECGVIAGDGRIKEVANVAMLLYSAEDGGIIDDYAAAYVRKGDVPQCGRPIANAGKLWGSMKKWTLKSLCRKAKRFAARWKPSADGPDETGRQRDVRLLASFLRRKGYRVWTLASRKERTVWEQERMLAKMGREWV